LKAAASVILEDTEILAELCGYQDKNIEYLESLFGSRIFTRGNEIILESGNKESKDLFASLIYELCEYSKKKREIHPDLILACWDAFVHASDSDVKDIKKTQVTIPQGFATVYPRNQAQVQFLEGLESKDLVFGIGPAGTGKTYLAIAQGLKELLSHKKRKLLLTRPVVEAGESLGFLPGDLSQKLNPYVKPLYDAMEAMIPGELITRMEENHSLEIAPLAYMRGRSLKDCYVILDEAQNTTREQMKMFLTRLGEGAKAVITGDISQIDLPRSKGSGLIQALDILTNMEEIHITHFKSQDVVRSKLVQKIINAYEDYENDKSSKEEKRN